MNRLFVFIFLLPLLVACSSAAKTSPPASLTITSPAFQPGQAIPAVYSCQGEDRSPALEWTAPPPGTQSLALLMDDPDAPGVTWVHWIVYNLPPGTRGLAEGAAQAGLPAGANVGNNSWGTGDYGGPCPPAGTHRYFFTLYALDIQLDNPSVDKAALLKAIEGHVLAQGELIGTYTK